MKSPVLVAGCAALFTLSALTTAASAEPAPAPSTDLMLADVVLRPGVSADIHIRVLQDPSPSCAHHGATAFAVHGATGAASNWAPLAEALFASDQSGQRLCRIAAVDLPGHGQSSLPQGMLFGDLTLHDYVTTVLQSFDRLDQQGIRPVTLLGHSQGGMVVQLAQQELQERGSSLRDELGVKHAILLASVGPRGLPWAFVDAGTAGAVLAPFVSFDPALGVHFYMPPSLWPLLVFTTPAGEVVPGAPSGAEIDARGYDSPEPIAALGELLGAPPAQRPYVAPGAFAHGNGTRLDVVAFAADAIILPAESAALYTYLTGEPACSGFTTVNGADVVHGAIISSPGAILSAIEDRVALP